VRAVIDSDIFSPFFRYIDIIERTHRRFPASSHLPRAHHSYSQNRPKIRTTRTRFCSVGDFLRRRFRRLPIEKQ